MDSASCERELDALFERELALQGAISTDAAAAALASSVLPSPSPEPAPSPSPEPAPSPSSEPGSHHAPLPGAPYSQSGPGVQSKVCETSRRGALR